jgi:hypothetical protein
MEQPGANGTSISVSIRAHSGSGLFNDGLAAGTACPDNLHKSRFLHRDPSTVASMGYEVQKLGAEGPLSLGGYRTPAPNQARRSHQEPASETLHLSGSSYELDHSLPKQISQAKAFYSGTSPGMSG